MEAPIYREGEFAIKRYGRHFALYQAGELVCVCVYKKGAASVLARLREAARRLPVASPVACSP